MSAVIPSQRARDAAADWLGNTHLDSPFSGHEELSEAFARFETETLEAAAKVAEEWEPVDQPAPVEVLDLRREVKAAILALRDPPAPDEEGTSDA